MKRKSIKPAFTLIELLIVVGLITVMLGLTLPGYGNFSRRRNFNRSVKTFISDITSVQSKSISGARPSTANIFSTREMWGLNINCSSSASDPNKGVYQIVYAYPSAADTVVETKNLNFGLTGAPYRINSINGSCPVSAQMYFSRFTGTGNTSRGLYASSSSVVFGIMSDQDSSMVSTVTIYRNGKIVTSP